MADTAAHETTHWAQRLGGRDAKRWSELIKQINAMADRKATVREALPLNIERRKLINRLEHGAATAGGNQAQRFQEYLKRNEPAFAPEQVGPSEKDWGRPLDPRSQLSKFLKGLKP